MTLIWDTYENRYASGLDWQNDISILMVDPSLGRMNPEEKERWIEALLSGKYEQGTMMLKTPDGNFCCLGVKCEVDNVPSYNAKVADLDGNSKPATYTEVTHYGDEHYGSYTFLPHGHEITLYDERGAVLFYHNGGSGLFRGWIQGSEDENEPARRETITLPLLNDSGFTFAQIADVIRYFL